MATNLATILVKLETNTRGFTSKLQTAEKSVQKFGRRTQKVTKQTVKGNKKIQSAFQNTAGSIAAVQGPLGPVAGRISSIGAIIGRVTLTQLAFTAAIIGTVVVLKSMVKVVANAERQMLKLKAILKATGGAANLSLGDIQDLSEEIGIATLASTQKVRDAAGILLTFKSIQGDVFKSALRLTQDLAEVGFGDLRTASMQLGKALEEPIVGLGALRRVGVSFTESQKEQIRVLSMTGEKTKAQEIIIRALNEQVGGAGVQAAPGLHGAIDSLREQFTLFFEQSKIGRAVVNFLTVAINKLADAMSHAEREIESLNTISSINQEILNTKEDIVKRNEQLEQQENSGFMTLGVDPKLEKLEAHLAGLEEKLRSVNAIIKDGIEATKKENELYNIKLNQVKEETDLGKIRATALNTYIRNTEREIENLGKTSKEMRELNQLRKIEDKLRSELKSDGPQAEAAIAAEMKKVTAEIRAQNELYQEQVEIQNQLDKIATTVGGTFASVGDKISDAMVRGKLHTLSFKDILMDITYALQKMIIKVLILDEIQRKIEERIKSTRSSGGGSIIGDIFKMFVGGKSGTTTGTTLPGTATGGSVSGSAPRLVGERGPELFVPHTAGSVTPSSLTPGKLGGGGGVNIVQNLNFAVGITNTVRAEVMNMLPAIQSSTLSAVADAKQRGGKFSKAFGS